MEFPRSCNISKFQRAQPRTVAIHRERPNREDSVPVRANVRYNRTRGYSQKYTIGYIPNTRNKHRNTQCDYIKVFIIYIFFYFKWLSNYKTFVVPQHL
jgi:hypothetical protein